MGVYEMGAAGTVLENVMVQEFCNSFGFDNGSGFFTSGGTLANLTVMLAARQSTAKADVWKEGQTTQYGLLVSEQAHYCIDRAVRIMGWGSNGIIKVPVDDAFKMRTNLIPEYMQQAAKDGIEVIAIMGSALSASTGVFDNLLEIAQYAKRI